MMQHWHCRKRRTSPKRAPLFVANSDAESAPPAREPIIYVWTCQYCGQPFKTTVYSQRYCNRTHREYAYRERKRSVDALSVNKNEV